jgi:tRNA(Ile)-lysidine synthase
MQMADSVQQHEFEMWLATSWPTSEWCGSHVVLAVSGGPDSVAMLRAMVAVKATAGGDGRLFVAHLNHGLRSAADEDHAWLQSLCQRLGIPLEFGRANVAKIAEEKGDGWEAAARLARYEFLRETAERVGARFVATGHTADDQAETVLHRVLRGTGIEGIAGIPKVRQLSPSVSIVRPLLNVRRADVLAYLSSIGQNYRIDASNEDTTWTRNRLRNDLLPELRERYNRRVDTALTRLAAQASEAQMLIRQTAEKVARDCIVRNAEGIQINCSKLEGQLPVVVNEVIKLAWRDAGWPLQSMGFDEWQQLAVLVARAEASSFPPNAADKRDVINLPGNIRARLASGVVVLEPLGGKAGFT